VKTWRTALAALAGVLSLAAASDPSERLKDPAQEAQAREIFKDVRCMVCQNQSIDDSDAPLARDLRVLVRERLTAGDSNRDVINFLTVRYGDFVLLRPRFTWSTAVLWIMPFMPYAALMAPPKPPIANVSMASATDAKNGSFQGSLPIQSNQPVAPFIRPAISSEAIMVNAGTRLGNRMTSVLSEWNSFQFAGIPGSMSW
jgi:cytochrome c-type biogenesis protein CcmH